MWATVPVHGARLKHRRTPARGGRHALVAGRPRYQAPLPFDALTDWHLRLHASLRGQAGTVPPPLSCPPAAPLRRSNATRISKPPSEATGPSARATTANNSPVAVKGPRHFIGGDLRESASSKPPGLASRRQERPKTAHGSPSAIRAAPITSHTPFRGRRGNPLLVVRVR